MAAANSLAAPRFLIRDRDDKFGTAFDALARATGIRMIRTAVRAPNSGGFSRISEVASTARTAVRVRAGRSPRRFRRGTSVAGAMVMGG
jgi:hypothetical protein